MKLTYKISFKNDLVEYPIESSLDSRNHLEREIKQSNISIASLLTKRSKLELLIEEENKTILQFINIVKLTML